METFGLFDPIVYAFRTFFKHIWLMLFCVLAVFAIGILAIALLLAINWPIISFFVPLIKQQVPLGQMAGLMGSIDVMNGPDMMNGLSAMGPEMMKVLALKFLPYVIVSLTILSILGVWVWTGLCSVALELQDKGSSSAKNIFTALRFVPKAWLSHVLWLIPFTVIFSLVVYSVVVLIGLMNFGRLLIQLIALLFILFTFLPIMFVNFYIIDKKNGPIAALIKSFSLTRSGGFRAYAALFLLVVLLFLFGFIPIVGNYIGLLLVALGVSYLYRKLEA